MAHTRCPRPWSKSAQTGLIHANDGSVVTTEVILEVASNHDAAIGLLKTVCEELDGDPHRYELVNQIDALLSQLEAGK